MRKLLVIPVALLLGSLAFAQVESEPGLFGGDESLNAAHADITISATLPDQVAFELPQAEFQISLAHVRP